MSCCLLYSQGPLLPLGALGGAAPLSRERGPRAQGRLGSVRAGFRPGGQPGPGVGLRAPVPEAGPGAGAQVAGGREVCAERGLCTSGRSQTSRDNFGELCWESAQLGCGGHLAPDNAECWVPAAQAGPAGRPSAPWARVPRVPGMCRRRGRAGRAAALRGGVSGAPPSPQGSSAGWGPGSSPGPATAPPPSTPVRAGGVRLAGLRDFLDQRI